jgi:hypothetical protein
MHIEQATDFSAECDQLLVGLEHFRGDAEAFRATLHLPPERATRKSGMPVVTHNHDVQMPERQRLCPASIRRLCKDVNAASSKTKESVTTPVVSGTRKSPRRPHAPDLPLLVKRHDDETVYDVTIITTESLTKRDRADPDDLVFIWSSVFRDDSPYRLACSKRTYLDWRHFLSSSESADVGSAIDGWLAAEVARQVFPWDEEMASNILSLVTLDHGWASMFVRLRPVRPTQGGRINGPRGWQLPRFRLSESRQAQHRIAASCRTPTDCER